MIRVLFAPTCRRSLGSKGRTAVFRGLPGPVRCHHGLKGQNSAVRSGFFQVPAPYLRAYLLPPLLLLALDAGESPRSTPLPCPHGSVYTGGQFPCLHPSQHVSGDTQSCFSLKAAAKSNKRVFPSTATLLSTAKLCKIAPPLSQVLSSAACFLSKSHSGRVGAPGAHWKPVPSELCSWRVAHALCPRPRSTPELGPFAPAPPLVASVGLSPQETNRLLADSRRDHMAGASRVWPLVFCVRFEGVTQVVGQIIARLVYCAAVSHSMTQQVHPLSWFIFWILINTSSMHVVFLFLFGFVFFPFFLEAQIG